VARILITADPGVAGGAVLYQERVPTTLLESDHAAAQLLERIKWAVGDAEAAERDAASEEA
jgi:hypothetical protein